jgi:hypothetical protein
VSKLPGWIKPEGRDENGNAVYRVLTWHPGFWLAVLENRVRWLLRDYS